MTNEERNHPLTDEERDEEKDDALTDEERDAALADDAQTILWDNIDVWMDDDSNVSLLFQEIDYNGIAAITPGRARRIIDFVSKTDVDGKDILIRFLETYCS